MHRVQAYIVKLIFSARSAHYFKKFTRVVEIPAEAATRTPIPVFVSSKSAFRADCAISFSFIPCLLGLAILSRDMGVHVVNDQGEGTSESFISYGWYAGAWSCARLVCSSFFFSN